MNKWELTKQFFNSKVSNKVFTRQEFILYIEKYGAKYYPLGAFDRYRCALSNSGYLFSEEPGVWRKLKFIPNDLTFTKARKQEHDNIKLRRQNARLV